MKTTLKFYNINLPLVSIALLIKLMAGVGAAIFLSACNQAAGTSAALPDSKPKTLIKVVKPLKQDLKEVQKVFATSLYLKRNVITAPVPAFITRVYSKLGDKVTKGQVLYTLETKERRALQSESIRLDSTLQGFGYLTIRAPASGIISTLDKQQLGDYVLEGTQLCSIAESSQLAFQLNLPYELTQYVQKHPQCDILLPDNRTLKGTITAPLTSMNLLAQTQPYLIKPQHSEFLPENLIASVLITTHEQKQAQTLLKDCVLSDELMQHYWVMKLISDSTAVKVPVQTGITQADIIEILSPQFGSADLILSEGNYGLADTASVKVLN